MKKLSICVFLTTASLLFPANIIFAANSPSMWVGEWTLYTNTAPYYDSLIISETKADCAGSPWCSLVLTYVRGYDGKRIRGRIENMGDIFRNMVFSVNGVKYDGHIFVHRTKMAGSISYPNAHVPKKVFYAIKRRR
ncbi:MAG: hypothetical protein JSW39_16625 [Desulfobacterales bacterium]|nr:MAG: hypothetical protein JSW39_16625 [Desulfobacterales bacterium]